MPCWGRVVGMGARRGLPLCRRASGNDLSDGCECRSIRCGLLRGVLKKLRIPAGFPRCESIRFSIDFVLVNVRVKTRRRALAKMGDVVCIASLHWCPKHNIAIFLRVSEFVSYSFPYM
ncbi:hypothetical protein PT2222_80201 [Paraburkholderia tropica]